MKIYYLPFLIVFFIMIGCSGNDNDGVPQNCASEISTLRLDRGSPDEIERYEQDGYHRYTYWYYAQGYSMTLEWGKNVDGCQSNSYTFQPISVFK